MERPLNDAARAAGRATLAVFGSRKVVSWRGGQPLSDLLGATSAAILP